MNPPGPVIEGSTVKLVCEATAGDVPISYSWTGPTGKELTNGEAISVTVSNREDYGNYTCTATNVVGADITVVKVTIAGILCLHIMHK